jgi:hypothetical protein
LPATPAQGLIVLKKSMSRGWEQVGLHVSVNCTVQGRKKRSIGAMAIGGNDQGALAVNWSGSLIR